MNTFSQLPNCLWIFFQGKFVSIRGRLLQLTGITLLQCVFLVFTYNSYIIRPLYADVIGKQTLTLNDPHFFPLGVWLQAPVNATKYKTIGINLYVGLWKGPTISQLKSMQKADMPVICDQNDIALSGAYDNVILGWLQEDEPDNSQKRQFGFFPSSPIHPLVIQDRYSQFKKRDPQRPVLLNLGQGVAWDQWWGRGIRTNHPEDYKEYIKGGDIISFDIYPVTHPHPEVRGRLEFIAKGVLRLKSFISPQQQIWSIISVSHINDPYQKPTPSQVRSQVWMSIIHGSHGIIYFVHQFKPRFIEAAIFEDREMMAELTQLNALIQSLADVLNSPDTFDTLPQKTDSLNAQVTAITKRRSTSLYLLSVGMVNRELKNTFQFSLPIPDQEAEVLGENRTIEVRKGTITDNFKSFEAHIYKIKVDS